MRSSHATLFERRQLRVAGVWHELRRRRQRGRADQRPVALADDPLVSMVCVSKRPEQLEHIVSMWQEQTHINTELVLVTNADGYGDIARERLGDLLRAQVQETDPSLSLGHALNVGIANSSGEVIAKIDDDDHYSSLYIADLVRCMRSTRSAVVGKKTYFVYLASSDRVLQMHPGNDNQRVGRVAGGTLAFHRDVADEIRFEDRTLGEDVTFVRAAERAGFSVYSDQPAGYIQVRRSELGHTWQISDTRLAQSGHMVGTGLENGPWQ